MGKPETTFKLRCIDIFTEQDGAVRANHEVIKCQKHADIEILRFSWISDCVCGKVWHTIVN